MYTSRWKRVGARAAVVGLLAGIPALASPAPAGAADADVVISEVMYHAGEDAGGLDDPYDFVELTNIGSDPVSLTGWTLTADSLSITFPDATLAPGARVVVASDAASFATRYGTPPSFAFAATGGRMRNSSATVRLSNAAAQSIDQIVYRDATPWPGAADGTGPSLERVRLTSPNTGTDADAANWLASLVANGTPGAANSVAGLAEAPTIGAVGHGAGRPQPSTPVRVDAVATNAPTVQLAFRVMFGAETTLPMADDASSAGGAGDGTWSAMIPGQLAGQLVRYRVTATNPSATVTSPAAGDSIGYHGYVVADPSLSTELPVIEWFMEDAVYEDLLANHRFDDVTGFAVVSFDGRIWDNARMRIRGNSTRAARKVSWNVELPSGYAFTMPGVPFPVDEFNLQRTPSPDQQISWELMHEIGFPQNVYFPVRTHRNGQFWSVGGYLGAIDGRWRELNDFDDTAFYKKYGNRLAPTATADRMAGMFEKKERVDEGFQDVWALTNELAKPKSDARRDYLLDNLDIANVVNYFAFVALIRHADSANQNWYLIRDTEGTGRWEFYPWDLDLVFGFTTDGRGEFLTAENHLLATTFMRHPEFKAMYVRRLKTLIDTYLPTHFLERFDELAVPMAPDWAIEASIWGAGDMNVKRNIWRRGVNERAALFARNTGNGRLIPPSQSASRPIVISEINYQPVPGGAPEFVELTNTSTTESFDLSGWQLTGVDLVLPGGTVLLPGARLVVTSDDLALRAVAPPVFVAAEFEGQLSDAGELVRLTDRAGQVIDEVTYGPRSPWPWTAGGTGRTLELVSLTADNSVAASWRPSRTTNGTPGTANQPDPSPVPPEPTVDVVLNEYNAVAPANLLDASGTDVRFGRVTGNGGDWFELVVVRPDTDLRGWRFEWRDTPGASGELRFTNDELWRSLPAGTIITVSEDVVEDVTLDPANGDWSINVRAGTAGTGTYVQAVPFDVTHDDWRLTIRDAAGILRFGPVGESVGSLTGVNSREVAALRTPPSEAVSPTSEYRDSTSSTFGEPNAWTGGTQDLSTLRSATPPTTTTTTTTTSTTSTTSTTTTLPNDSPRLALVTGGPTLASADRRVHDRLVARGYLVTVIDDDVFDGAALGDADLVLISSSVLPSTLGPRLNTVTLPIVSWEAYLADELGLATAGVEGAASTTLQIVAPTSPATGGASGVVAISTSAAAVAKLTGVPAGALVVARGSDGTAAMVTADRDAVLATGVAPSRRVALPWAYGTPLSLTDAGWRMFDASITWSLG